MMAETKSPYRCPAGLRSYDLDRFDPHHIVPVLCGRRRRHLGRLQSIQHGNFIECDHSEHQMAW